MFNVETEDTEKSPLLPKLNKTEPENGAKPSKLKEFPINSTKRKSLRGEDKRPQSSIPQRRLRSASAPSSCSTSLAQVAAPSSRCKRPPRQPTPSSGSEKSTQTNCPEGHYGALRNNRPTGTAFLGEKSSVSCNVTSDGESSPGVDSDVESSGSSESSDGTFSIRGLSGHQKFLLLNVLLSDFLTSCCLSLLAPFFPQEAHNKNISDDISGWIFGSYSLTQFVFAPICGKLLPRIGGRFMYLAGGFWSGGCTILFGVLEYVPIVSDGGSTFIALCFVLRIVLAIGCTALQTAGYAFAFNEFPNSIATVFGIMEVFVGLGFMAGPALGGLLYEVGGFYLPFVTVGGLILISVPINYCFIPELEDPGEGDGEGTIWKLLKMPSIFVMNLVVVVGSIIWSILDPTLAPRLNEFSLTPSIVGLIFLLMSAFYALTAPVWGRIADKMEDNKLLLIPGFVFSAVSLLLLGPSPIFGLGADYNELWLNVLSLCLLGMSCSLAIIPSFDVFLDLAETVGFEENVNTYGVVAGLWSSMNALGDFIGPSIGGVMLTGVGFQLCMTYTALACTVVVVLLVVMVIAERCGKKPNVQTGDPESRRQSTTVKNEDKKSLIKRELEFYTSNPYLLINCEIA